MPIVAGIDAFRDAMAGFEDKYVLIGGGACSLLFEGTPVESGRTGAPGTTDSGCPRHQVTTAVSFRQR